MKRISMLLAAAALALAAFAGAAAAAPTPTPSPSGQAGALNMLNDPTMLPGAGGAMDHANPNGDTGMFGAVCHSIGVGC
jgi:hypothetical protein